MYSLGNKQCDGDHPPSADESLIIDSELAQGNLRA